MVCDALTSAGGLTEPPVVPRFLASLESVGARPVRLSAYETSLGSTPEECQAEALMLDQGHVAAIAFSSTAEVGCLATMTHMSKQCVCLNTPCTVQAVRVSEHTLYCPSSACV